MRTPRRLPEVFIAHASHDREFVRKLARSLTRRRIRIWYSEKHIPGSTQWHNEIGRALQRCSDFAVVLSPKAVSSVWVQHELVYALSDPKFRRIVMPLLLKDCHSRRLSWTLRSFQFIDFRRSFDAGINQFIRAVRSRHAKLKRKK